MVVVVVLLLLLLLVLVLVLLVLRKRRRVPLPQRDQRRVSPARPMLAAVVRAVVAQLAAEVAHDPREQHVVLLPQPLPVFLGLGLGCGTLASAACGGASSKGCSSPALALEGVAARLRGWGGGGGTLRGGGGAAASTRSSASVTVASSCGASAAAYRHCW